MSPPIATEALTSTVTANGVKGKTVNHDQTVQLKGESQGKLLDDFAGKWDTFKFAPIRESQVSRAM